MPNLIQRTISQYESLHTQTCADIDQLIAYLAECAEANNFADVQTNAHALTQLAAEAKHQQMMLTALWGCIPPYNPADAPEWSQTNERTTT